MKDSYFFPNTVKKCHERIEGYQHTNRVQAEELGQLKQQLHEMDLKLKMAETKALIAHQRADNMLSEFQALKAMLRMLGREDLET